MIIPQHDSDKRHNHHAVEKERAEYDNDEDVERPAKLRTETRCSVTVSNALAVGKLLQKINQ